jgi:tetratricopeptide (TPR) repeat protein/transcriptional regulator with XRE-family HTH domain
MKNDAARGERKQGSDRWIEFGIWLKQERKRAGLTQQQAALAAGMAPMSWWRLERGLSGTRMDTLPNIARAIRADLRETYLSAGFVPPVSLEAADHEAPDPSGMSFAATTETPLRMTPYALDSERDARQKASTQPPHALQRPPDRTSALDVLYAALTPGEQMVLRRLSVLRTDWTQETAIRVCTGRGLEESEIVPLLTQLVNLHYLYSSERTTPTRYGFLGPLREYCAVQLAASGEANWAWAQYRSCFVRFVEKTARMLETADVTGALDLLDAERKEWEAVLEDCLQAPDQEDAVLRMAVALGRYWERQGQIVVGRAWIGRALDHSSQRSTELRAQCLNWAGNLAHAEGALPESQAYFEQALEVREALAEANSRGIANVKSNLGMVLFDLGRYEDAIGYLQQSLELRRQANDERGIAISLNWVGNTLLRLNDYPAARLCYEECLHLGLKHQIRVLAAHAANGLGLLSLYEGNYAQARERFDQGSALFEALGDDEGRAKVLGNLARLHQKEGRRAEARALCEESLALCEKIDANEGRANALDQLGNLSRLDGDLRGAWRRVQESLMLRREMDDRLGIAVSLEQIARLEFESRQPLRATQLLAAATELRSQLRASTPDDDQFDTMQLRRSLKDSLGVAAYEAAWQEGRALPPAEAIAVALQEAVEVDSAEVAEQRAG